MCTKTSILRHAVSSLALAAMVLLAPAVSWGQTTLFSEDFEDGSMPAGWTTEGNGSWSVATAVNSTHPSSAGNGTYCAQITHGTTGNATKLITPEIDLSGVASAELSFMHAHQSWSGDIDELKIYYPDEVLSEIIFGYRTKDENIQQITNLIKENYKNLQEIRFYKAIPNRNKFTIELRDLF